MVFMVEYAIPVAHVCGGNAEWASTERLPITRLGHEVVGEDVPRRAAEVSSEHP